MCDVKIHLSDPEIERLFDDGDDWMYVGEETYDLEVE